MSRGRNILYSYSMDKGFKGQSPSKYLLYCREYSPSDTLIWFLHLVCIIQREIFRGLVLVISPKPDSFTVLQNKYTENREISSQHDFIGLNIYVMKSIPSLLNKMSNRKWNSIITIINCTISSCYLNIPLSGLEPEHLKILVMNFSLQEFLSVKGG